MARALAVRLGAVVGLILRLSRPAKRAVMVLFDVCAIPIALWTALTLRLGSFDHGEAGSLWLYAVAVATSVPVFVRFGLYRAVVRFMVPRAVFAVLAGVAVSVVLTLLVSEFALRHAIPLSAHVIYFLIATLYVAGSRLLVRHLPAVLSSSRSRVIIYGAGNAGVKLATALQQDRDFQAVAFVDDNRSLHAHLILGLEVFAPERLESLIDEYQAERVLLAMPSASRARRRAIIAGLEHLGVHVQTVPDFSDVVSGRARVEDVREIEVADILGRDAVPPDPKLLGACIEGKVVMVTGAGGSIGSELCRQIVRLRPKSLVLLEMSEHALYSIHRELEASLREQPESIELVALVGNAHHKHRMRQIMQSFGVQTVYHAAAYKHVPIVEQNVSEGIHNNVIATLHTAVAALETGVETFVLISTDKAVNPTNVMGATKRVAELVLQGLHERSRYVRCRTRFCMVRFGNVLDSSGSVVPLFREQIRRGGPVTVTHPEITRYFMTIPEAAQLVLQAGSMGQGGDVFVLDMGEPVRIDDLARRMIGLMGLTVQDEANPDGDIAIEYTGLRPGEKLYEELLIGDNVTRTEHPMIMRAMEHSLPWEQVRLLLIDLLEAARGFDCQRAIELLATAVAEYRPAPAIADIVAVRQSQLDLSTAKVTDFPLRRRGKAPTLAPA